MREGTKNGFSQLVKDAIGGTAQFVTVHGKPAAVVVSAAEYARLNRRHQGKLSAALLRPDIAADAELAGSRLPVLDGLIMATAQCHGLTVVTRNTENFRFYPQVFNPWQP